MSLNFEPFLIFIGNLKFQHSGVRMCMCDSVSISNWFKSWIDLRINKKVISYLNKIQKRFHLYHPDFTSPYHLIRIYTYLYTFSLKTKWKKEESKQPNACYFVIQKHKQFICELNDPLNVGVGSAVGCGMNGDVFRLFFCFHLSPPHCIYIYSLSSSVVCAYVIEGIKRKWKET